MKNKTETKPKLRVGLLMDAIIVPNWKAILIERLMTSHYATIELIILNDTVNRSKTILRKFKDNWPHLTYMLYERIDQIMFKVQPNAFEPIDISALLAGIPTMKVRPVETKYTYCLSDADIAEIQQFKLDVLIRLGFRSLHGKILTAAKFGVWSYKHEDEQLNRGCPAGFWEVMENWEITGSILQILSEDIDTCKVLVHSYSRTDKHSLHRNRNTLYWKSLSFVPRELERLYRLGTVNYFEHVNQKNRNPIFYTQCSFTKRDLSNWKILKYILALGFRMVKNWWTHIFFLNQWILLFSLRRGWATSFWGYKKIQPPKDRFYADPFIIYQDGCYYIFIEELIYNRNKGHISVIVMDEKGHYEKPVRIIEQPYHLSYPFIFHHFDNIYLIPESRNNKTIELYKCIEFPYKWEYQKKLMADVEAVDATLFYYHDIWWLFANMVENPGASSHDELFLFFADNLNTDEWTPHPKNPIVTDVRKSRPAGKIFYWNDRIIRPAQNSAKRYGYGIKLNEIVVINEYEYEEIEIEAIAPNWDKDLVATHTLNRAGNLTMIDALWRRNRFF